MQVGVLASGSGTILRAMLQKGLPIAALLLFDSRTYNHGRPFIAPIPIVSYDLGPARLNAVYAPRVTDLNDFAVFGFYLSVPLPR